jgi:hypothetical protein
LWRPALPVLVICLASAKAPWDSIGTRVRTSWRCLEWKVRNLGDGVMDGIEDVRRGYEGR